MNRFSFFALALVTLVISATDNVHAAEPIRRLLGHTSHGDFFLDTTEYESNGATKYSEVIITPKGKSISAKPYGLACYDGGYTGKCNRPTVVETMLDVWLVTESQVYVYNTKEDDFSLRMNHQQRVMADVSHRETEIVAFVCLHPTSGTSQINGLLIFSGGRWSMTDPPSEESARTLGAPLSVSRDRDEFSVRTSKGDIRYNFKQRYWGLWTVPLNSIR